MEKQLISYAKTVIPAKHVMPKNLIIVMNVMMDLHYRYSSNRNTVFALPPWILALLMLMLTR
jgi:hypothetical protein